MRKRTIYLAGAIQNVSIDEANVWRNVADDRLNKYFKVLNPMRRNVINRTFQSDQEIIALDKDDINNSNIILANMNDQSIGTTMEIMYSYMKDKIVISYINKENNDISPWLRHHSAFVAKTLDQAINYIIKNF